MVHTVKKRAVNNCRFSTEVWNRKLGETEAVKAYFRCQRRGTPVMLMLSWLHWGQRL